MRLPLILSNRRCERCGRLLDDLGDHRAACLVSGRLRRRVKPIELAWAAICAEAGAVVADHVLLRYTKLPVESGDSPQLDFVAWNLRGISRPICGDATIVSPLHRDGTPHALTPEIDGASWLVRTNVENLPSWLAKREAGGIIEPSRWVRRSSRRRRRRLHRCCSKQQPLCIIDADGSSSPWRSNTQ